MWKEKNRAAFFWVITQRVVLIPYGLFGTNKIWTLEDGNDRFLETSVRNYHYSLTNSPEERSSYLLPGGSLKSRVERKVYKLLSRLGCKYYKHPSKFQREIWNINWVQEAITALAKGFVSVQKSSCTSLGRSTGYLHLRQLPRALYLVRDMGSVVRRT